MTEKKPLIIKRKPVRPQTIEKLEKSIRDLKNALSDIQVSVDAIDHNAGKIAERMENAR